MKPKKLDLDYFLGIDELELTDEVINKLVQEKKFKSKEDLKKFALLGYKWNTKRNSLVLTF